MCPLSDGHKMLIPIYDDDSNLNKPAYFTIGLLVANIIFFFFQTNDWVFGFGLIPQELVNGTDYIGNIKLSIDGESQVIPQNMGPYPIYLTLITSMFMHGDWLHLGFNMLYLWIFGDNIEHILGTKRFVWFYLLTGIIGGLAQVALQPDSWIPMIGASGAISGILGAYLVLLPRNKVRVLFLFIFRFSVPALLLLGVWIALQVINGLEPEATDQTAYAAHLGGFVAGVLGGFFVRFFTNYHQQKTA
ncbi:MAG TPA: rhomboid family intramembrane serine protease [Rhodothermales bacterium]|nr:rhomboid family intramembrane serine protease [Rhodothermales bacterium]